MTKEEIKNKIEDLENRIWMVEMADFLSREDKEWIFETKNEIRRLEKELEKI